MVTNITFHNPAVLARQALTVDHVSGGRLELGIGAGGTPSDHDMTGVPYWDPPERTSRLCDRGSRPDAPPLLVFPRASDDPFDSDDAFHDFVGRYREIGIDEFIIYWWREDALAYGYDRSIVERCADREMIEHLATETIPALRAGS